MYREVVYRNNTITFDILKKKYYSNNNKQLISNRATTLLKDCKLFEWAF